HYQRILNYITPDHIHVMMNGRIVLSGGPEVAHDLESKGYEGLRAELGVDEPEPSGQDARDAAEGQGMAMTRSIDVELIRKDFPILERRVGPDGDRRLV